MCVKRTLSPLDVIDALADLFILYGPPPFVRADSGQLAVAVSSRGRGGTSGAG